MNARRGTRWWSWQRILCLAITAAALTFVFRRIDAEALRHSLAHVRIGWFAAAFLIYGLSLLLGGLRWHIMLHAIRCAVHVGVSVRFALIGHFFFLVLLGAAAGDVAKAALYARWYRFGVPELTASSPLDRALGVLAAVIVGGFAVFVGIFSGGFEALASTRIDVLNPWILGIWIAVIVVALALGFWKPSGGSFWARGWSTLRGGTKNFVSSRRQLSSGLGFAILAQLAMSGVFALNVRAVAGGSLPWLQLAWTFPVIMMLSCLPITVAGAGVREMLSLAFLGLYGVPADACVGAAMLTFLCKVSWSLIGGFVLWRESVVQERRPAAWSGGGKSFEVVNSEAGVRGAASTISVVIPALNEAESLPPSIERLRKNDSIQEIIVVDGGSTDRTPEVAEQLGCRVLTAKSGRGGQMRAGAEIAAGDVILLLHADTWLPPEGTQALLDCLRDRAVVAGGFWKEFRDSPFLLLGSKWKCAIRLWIGRRVAGDQAMFIRRAALEKIGGIPDMALMEEFALCSRLHRVGRLALADAVVLTSARRFQKRGVIRTYLRMWRVATQYRLGTAPSELRKLYERD